MMHRMTPGKATVTQKSGFCMTKLYLSAVVLGFNNLYFITKINGHIL